MSKEKAQHENMADYIDRLERMKSGIDLFNQFWNKKSRASVAIIIDLKAAQAGMDREKWMFLELKKKFEPDFPATSNLHDRHQAPIHEAFAPNFIKKR